MLSQAQIEERQAAEDRVYAERAQIALDALKRSPGPACIDSRFYVRHAARSREDEHFMRALERQARES